MPITPGTPAAAAEVPAPKKPPIAKLCIAAAVVIVLAAVLLLRGTDPHVAMAKTREGMERGIDFVRSAGPWAFFAAMTVLPAMGAPLLAFTIPAGDAFASRMTMPGVIAAALVAIALNLALTYWLARYAVKPVASRILARYGYRVPQVSSENALSITLLIRLTPGPPYFMQGYMLGVAEVPFRVYLVTSWLCILPWAIGAIVLGRGFFSGNFKLAATGLGLLVAAIALVNALRHRYASRAR